MSFKLYSTFHIYIYIKCVRMRVCVLIITWYSVYLPSHEPARSSICPNRARARDDTWYIAQCACEGRYAEYHVINKIALKYVTSRVINDVIMRQLQIFMTLTMHWNCSFKIMQTSRQHNAPARSRDAFGKGNKWIYKHDTMMYRNRY